MKDEKERTEKLTLRVVPTRRVIENSKKHSKKIQKIKMYHYGFISSQNRLEKAEREKKCKLSFRSVPAQRAIENSKKFAKKFKKLKKHSYDFFSSKT